MPARFYPKNPTFPLIYEKIHPFFSNLRINTLAKLRIHWTGNYSPGLLAALPSSLHELFTLDQTFPTIESSLLSI